MDPEADFPTVTVETGWSENHAELEDDARLWLLYTQGQTRLVIVVEFTEGNTKSTPKVGPAAKGPAAGDSGPDFGAESDRPGVETEKLRVGGDGAAVESEELELESGRLGVEAEEAGARDNMPEVLNEGLEVGDALPEVDRELGTGRDEVGNYDEEQMVVDSIDGTTSFYGLAARLWELNRQGKLSQPLLGDLGATIKIYKAKKDGNDIEPAFEATILPPPTKEAKAPTGFGISLEDLLGDRVPDNQNPKSVVWFSFERLKKFITTSLSKTEKCRADDRAVKLLKEAGEWEERETWAQGKRRRLNEQL